MCLVDTHCHLDKTSMETALETIFTNAARFGVNRLLCVGFDVVSSAEGIIIADNRADKTPDVWAAVGIHPHEASMAVVLPDELKKMLLHPRVVALGEIGLDFFYDNSPRDDQRRIFCEQICLALEVNKPIIAHIRDARERRNGDANGESLRFLRECRADKVGGVIHCFSGNIGDAEVALEMGFYISFAGPVTYPKNEELRNVAAAIPLDRILCETDSPYLAPQGFRGKRNEPANVRSVYEKIAEIRGQWLEEFAQAVWENGNRIFGWDESRNVSI